LINGYNRIFPKKIFILEIEEENIFKSIGKILKIVLTLGEKGIIMYKKS